MSSIPTFVRYRDDLEVIAPDEDEIIEKIVASMSRANHAVADKHRHGLRDAHAKSHGILKGELRVHDHAPAEYRQGLFAEPATYSVIIRYSTAPGDLRPDHISAARGFAIKVIGAPGPRALDDGASTQDFLIVSNPTLPFGTLEKYLKLQKILEAQPAQSDTQLASASKRAYAAAKVLTALKRPLPVPLEVVNVPNADILGDTFYSMGALRHGDYVAKISATPLTPELAARAGGKLATGDHPHRDAVISYYRDHPADFDVRIQLCADIDRMPIEDASVLWSEELSPFVSVASIHIPAQDAYSDARRIYADDVLSFSPWHALEAHRPLGQIQRSRLKAYPSSSGFRHGYNRITQHEPASIDELPD